jgi:hypothetical protein
MNSELTKRFKKYTEDVNYVQKHFLELQKKYPTCAFSIIKKNGVFLISSVIELENL